VSAEPPVTLRPPARGARAALDNPALRGVGLMFIGTFFVAAMIGSIRHMSATLHPFEIALFRNLFALVVVLPWFYRYGIAPLRTQRFGLHVLRALFNIVAMLAFFYAVSVAPLSEVTALGFSSPIFATVLAALVLGEVVRPRRWAAIAIGFVGALIILRPGFASIGLGQMLALLSALAWSCALMVIKTLGRTDSSATIISYMGLLMVPLSLGPALLVWQWPAAHEWGWLLAIGVLGGLGQLCVTEALRQADTAVVMPIDFFKLIWVALIAYLAFAEHLDLYTWIGGGVIFASAISLVYRDRAAHSQT
jgi:drug/metabolite transporter (DMT)-like permease